MERDAEKAVRAFGGANESRTCLIADRPRLSDRLRARWRHLRLDLALAAGTPAESGAALALRARRLTDLSNRRALAVALRDVVRQAREGQRPSYAKVVPCQSRVVDAGEELSTLADALFEPGPVAPRGVAQARMLLTDGTGALFNPRSEVSLRASAVTAIENLRVRSA
jgi:hypothetical protein